MLYRRPQVLPKKRPEGALKTTLSGSLIKAKKLYIKRKNLCHQQWQQNNANLACFIAITTLSFLNNWKWEMLYEEQNIQWKRYIIVLKLLKVYNTTKDRYSFWTYFVFIQKSECILLVRSNKKFDNQLHLLF